MCRRALFLLLFALTCAVTSCAKMGAPPGGAEDKTGPKVAKFFPQRDATRVSRRITATLEFSEPVNRSSVEAALFLSPDPGSRLRYRWRNSRLDLIYLDSLAADRTYVISVGSQAKDLRGNAAGESFTIAFSTGEHIDRGRIEGTIAGAESPRAVMLWAYEVRGDSVPDPQRRIADYALQASTDGTFRFIHIRAGTYRVFAVVDRNRNHLWDPVSEPIGVPPWEVSVTDSTMPWVCFRLSEQDTSLPHLRSVREVNRHQLDLRFSRPVRSVQTRVICESDTLPAIAALPDTADDKVRRACFADALPAGVWPVMIEAEDQSRRSALILDSVAIRGRADTVRPRLVRSFPVAGGMTRLVPDSVVLEFSEPLRHDSLWASDFKLMIGDSDSIHVALEFPEPNRVLLRPEWPFTEGKRYILRCSGYRIMDWAGNALQDSLAELRFRVLPADSLGTLVGELSGCRGEHLIRVLALKGAQEICVTSTVAPGVFSVPRLVPGKYRVEVTHDADGNGQYSAGRMFPLEFSEPFVLFPDTVTIRARWDYEARFSWPPNPLE